MRGKLDAKNGAKRYQKILKPPDPLKDHDARRQGATFESEEKTPARKDRSLDQDCCRFGIAQSVGRGTRDGKGLLRALVAGLCSHSLATPCLYRPKVAEPSSSSSKYYDPSGRKLVP